MGTGRGAQVDFSTCPFTTTYNQADHAMVLLGKLGLLPKRPISLVRPQSPPVSGTGAEAGVGAPRIAAAHSESTTDGSTDREEPEFVENPFEDQA